MLDELKKQLEETFKTFMINEGFNVVKSGHGLVATMSKNTNEVIHEGPIIDNITYDWNNQERLLNALDTVAENFQASDLLDGGQH